MAAPIVFALRRRFLGVFGRRRLAMFSLDNQRRKWPSFFNSLTIFPSD